MIADDQQLLMTSFEALLDRYRALPIGSHGYVAYSEALQTEIDRSGYLEIVDQPGYGTLEAALLVEAVAACPVSIEIAASALIAPLVGSGSAPLALAWGLGTPVRFLPQAQTVCLFQNGEVLVGNVSPNSVRTVESVVAYPVGVLSEPPSGCVRYTGDEAAAIKRRALIGIAAEAVGLMRAALDHTVQYVKERQQFGQPLGNFQVIQHRLAEDAQLVRAARWLALRAADLDDDAQAGVALLYVQEAIRKVIHDCHQFTGAMGLTLEFPLHLWTFRLKFLQGEGGGKQAQSAIVANHAWPNLNCQKEEVGEAALG